MCPAFEKMLAFKCGRTISVVVTRSGFELLGRTEGRSQLFTCPGTHCDMVLPVLCGKAGRVIPAYPTHGKLYGGEFETIRVVAHIWKLDVLPAPNVCNV